MTKKMKRLTWQVIGSAAFISLTSASFGALAGWYGVLICVGCLVVAAPLIFWMHERMLEREWHLAEEHARTQLDAWTAGKIEIVKVPRSSLKIDQLPLDQGRAP